MPNKARQRATCKKTRARKAKKNNNGGWNQLERSSFRFHPVDSKWQKEACSKVGVQYQRPCHFGYGSPDCLLTGPNFQTVRRILADGNCLFRSFSMIITGSQEGHLAVRRAILNHMQNIAPLLLGAHVTQDSIAEYIQDIHMDRDGAWGTDVEILTLAHLLQTNIYVFDTSSDSWLLYSPYHLDHTLPVDSSAKSMYIVHFPQHFEVVSSVVKAAT